MKIKTSKNRMRARKALAPIKKSFQVLNSVSDGIDARKLALAFPNKTESLHYIRSLIQEFGE